ncbi:DedA family protein [Haloechinothrix sp. LS1_15]|nr:DedA family protein [Haloechinothrix sp. LS1_15]
MDWSDAATIGYPALFGGVLIGSITPVLPTGAIVSAAAAVAMTTSELSMPAVLVLAVLAASIGDVVTYSIGRIGSGVALRWLTKTQPSERLEAGREQFRRRGWQIIIVGRLIPAGRIPVLLAAAALSYPWQRLVPVTLAAAGVWAIAYSFLGIVSGGIFETPLPAILLAVALVFLVTALTNLVSRHRNRLAASTGNAGSSA